MQPMDYFLHGLFFFCTEFYFLNLQPGTCIRLFHSSPRSRAAVAMSRFEPEQKIKYEKLQENIEIVRKR